ncbi:MAG: hypothetical protein JSS02_24280, partial [Planctomycetes bacterium]|nr:hypothetical protein [Planctomycetota bacterium]
MNSFRFSDPARRRGLVWWLLPGLLFWFATVRPAKAEDPTAKSPAPTAKTIQIDKIAAGFQGWRKVGEWTPVWVTLTSSIDQDVSVVVEAPDADDNLVAYPPRQIRLQAGTLARVETSMRAGRLKSDLQVRVLNSQGEVQQTRRLSTADEADSPYRPALQLNTPIWISVGLPGLAGDAAKGPDPATPAGEPRVVTVESLDELPERVPSLESIELLILPTGATSTVFNQLDPRRSAELRDWVRQGGHLLISLASRVDDFSKSPFKEWELPIKFEGQFPLRQLSQLETYSGTNSPLQLSGVISAARFSQVDPQHI